MKYFLHKIHDFLRFFDRPLVDAFPKLLKQHFFKASHHSASVDIWGTEQTFTEFFILVFFSVILLMPSQIWQ